MAPEWMYAGQGRGTDLVCVGLETEEVTWWIAVLLRMCEGIEKSALGNVDGKVNG